MEPRTERTVLSTADPLGTTLQEQGIELDYVLPDYYPDVCKLVKCFVTPSVLSESVSGNSLSYELRAEVRILYCSEHSNMLQCVTQTLLFSRTAELPAGEELSVEILPAVDYVNARAVSRRRLDVRGAVTVRIRTVARKRLEVLSNLSGKGIQLRKTPVQFPAKELHSAQSIIVSDDLELGSTQPALLHVVRCEARPANLSKKFVSGKLMVQGDLRLQILYACERDGGGSLEPLSFTLPFSQLLDMNELDEQDDIRISCTAASCDLKPSAEANGDIRALHCEAELRVQCHVVRTVTEQVVCDAFSTEHPGTCKTVEFLSADSPVPFSEMQITSAKLTCTDGEPDCVYDAWCEVRNISSEISGGEILLTGMQMYYIMIRDGDGMPRLLEREEPFEHRFSPGQLGGEDMLSVSARSENCTYTLSGASEVTVKSELRMEGCVTHCSRISVLSDMEIQENADYPHDFALKLYYGKAGEPVWDIAKRCHTSVSAVMDENDLSQETLTEAGMLLIPIVN